MDDQLTSADSLQSLLDSFVAITSERDDESILAQSVDLARLATQSRFGAGVTVGAAGITLFVHQGLTKPQFEAMPHFPEGYGLLEAVLLDQAPIRLDHMSEDPRSVGFPLGHVAMESLLGVPILFEGDLRGALYLTKPPGHGGFSERDELFMMSLAAQTAVALETSRILADKDQINEQLMAANQLKSDFVSMASHELRTPLTSIVGFASTLTKYWDTTPESDRLEYLSIIDRQGTRLMRLVNDLLSMSRIEAGGLESNQSNIELTAAVDHAIQEVGDLVSDIAVDVPSDLSVHADPDHLQQILINFLANAIRYGGPPISISATAVDEFVQIVVADNGEGVPESFVPQLFEKFTQAQSGSTRTATGTGLGLSIVFGLAEANGGTVWYEPNQPVGSQFFVKLPRAIK